MVGIVSTHFREAKKTNGTDDSDHSGDVEEGDPLDELKDFNAKNLYEKLINLSDDEFEAWLKAMAPTHSRFSGDDVMYNLWKQISQRYPCN
jgi:hypothetical protein